MTKYICFLWLSVLVLSGCDNSTWQSCNLGGMSGAECTTIEVPLDWQKTGQKIDLSVRRYLSPLGRTKQIWLVDGGPGGNGDGLADANLLQPLLNQGWNVYIPSHRGTGLSTPLYCAEQQADSSPGGEQITDEEVADCLNTVSGQWGEGLAAFNTKQAAQDLGFLIDTFAKGNTVSVYALSYGTNLVQTYLQYYPHQVNSVVLDSVLGLDADVWMQDVYANESGKKLFQFCVEDEVCKQKLNGDPLAALQNALVSIDNQSCDLLSDIKADDLRQMLLLTLSIGFETRVLAPAIVHRINQCTDQSTQELRRLMGILEEIAAAMDKGENRMLFFNVLFNSFWKAEKSAEELREIDNGLYFSSLQQSYYAQLYADWPVGDAKPINTQIITTVPVLVLQGGLDPATPPHWAQAAVENFSPSPPLYVYFEQAGHVTLTSTPTTEDESCAFNIMMEFISRPHVLPDTTCQGRLLKLDFAGTSVIVQQMSQFVFGNSLWGE